MLHPAGMRRSVESYIVFLCIPSGLHPSTTLLARFAAHRLSMDGMPLCRGFFVGLSSFARNYLLQADKQKEMTSKSLFSF
jgi:hypothetical protein